MTQPTIQISAPVRNREKYLPSYLDAIYNQHYDKKLITLHFLVNDSTDSSESILLRFKNDHSHEYRKIKIETYNTNCPEDIGRETNVRINYIYNQLSVMRNRLLRSNRSAFYLSVDSDIMMHNPETINKFIENDKHICAGLILNGHHVEEKTPELYPNILERYMQQIGNIIAPNYRHVRNFKHKGIVLVNFTGAIICMKKCVTDNKDIFYGFHIWGEDAIFCEKAEEQGYQLFCDTDLKATHCMTEDYLSKYINGEFIFK